MAGKKDERCVLCLDEKRSPVSVQCGHSFCFECLNVYKSYQKYAWANKCPICRSYLKEKKRAVKRKFTPTNANRENPIALTTANPFNTATSTATLNENQSESTEAVHILEEFMALAAADSVEFTVSPEQLTQEESQSIVDSQDFDIGDTDDYEESDYDDYDNDNELDSYTDSDEEIFYLFTEDDEEEISLNNLTSPAAYDFGDVINASVTENNDSTTNITDSELGSDGSISTLFNNELENDSTLSTVDYNNNSNSSSRNSTITSQDIDSDVASLENSVITD